MAVEIGWGHPSPLETYYRQNNLEYPFRMLSTTNYRGHVATWEIDGGKFYLVELAIEKENFKPESFKIASKDKSFSTKDIIFS